MSEFKYFQLEDHGSVTVARLENCRFDSEQLAQIRHETSQIANRQSHEFVFDFSSIEYVPSTMLAILIANQKMIRSRNAELIHSGFSEALKKLLKVTRVDKVICMVDSIDDGLQNFAQRRIYRDFTELQNDSVIATLVVSNMQEDNQSDYFELNSTDVPIIADRLFDLGISTSEDLRALRSGQTDHQYYLRFYRAGKVTHWTGDSGEIQQ